MQMANSTSEDLGLRRHVRQATRQDASLVQRLLRMGVYVHIHVDWRLPEEWLGSPGFVIFDPGPGKGATHRADAVGCLAITALPPPAAWVRVAAVESTAGYAQTEAMFAAILETLEPDIDEIAWFLTDYWPLQWLERLGFVPVSEVLGFQKGDLAIPPVDHLPDLEIRPLLIEDLPALAAIETAAFEARWRHSAEDLYLAWRHSICFQVALWAGELVGFQFSTGGQGAAHLSRMTVHPDRQGMGIGAALLADAVSCYRRQNIDSITLNTQSDNHASRRLYERFGFRPTGYTYPVWSYFPPRD